MKNPAPQPLQPGDYYFTENGLMVFTEQYHRRRGYCCKSGCRHCPYGYKKASGLKKSPHLCPFLKRLKDLLKLLEAGF